jgi:signal transduction histidine kinase
VDAAGREIRLTVANEGPGIPPETLAGLFQEFASGPGGAQGERTGLGLSISRKLAEQMGGTIRADSQPGEGARFHVTLPGARGADRTSGTLRAVPALAAATGRED